MSFKLPGGVSPGYEAFDGRAVGHMSQNENGLFLLEAILDPSSFCEHLVSSGAPEIITLYRPLPGQKLVVTHIDVRGKPKDRGPVVLDHRNPCMALQEGDHIIMDATETTTCGYLAYTCLCKDVRYIPPEYT